MTIRDFYHEFGHGPAPDIRVRVLAHSRYKKDNLLNLCGTMRTDQSQLYGTILVRLDGLENDRSHTGCFYFKPDELEILNDNIMEEKSMNNITNYLNIAKIQYLDNDMPSRYDYANFDQELKTGDLCVVNSAHHGLGLALVVEIQDRNNVELQREIVTKVDINAFNERVNIRKQATELKAKMQERAKQLQDIALYQMLAKEDSEMMELLGRFQSLPKV